MSFCSLMSTSIISSFFLGIPRGRLRCSPRWTGDGPSNDGHT
jgi:hypothetical protein